MYKFMRPANVRAKCSYTPILTHTHAIRFSLKLDGHLYYVGLTIFESFSLIQRMGRLVGPQYHITYRTFNGQIVYTFFLLFRFVVPRPRSQFFVIVFSE